jgi:hypothetical protein
MPVSAFGMMYNGNGEGNGNGEHPDKTMPKKTEQPKTDDNNNLPHTEKTASRFRFGVYYGRPYYYRPYYYYYPYRPYYYRNYNYSRRYYGW